MLNNPSSSPVTGSNGRLLSGPLTAVVMASCLLVAACSPAPEITVPRFSDYESDPAPPPVQPAPLLLADGVLESYSDILQAASTDGVSFASRYAMAIWSCGTGCEVSAVIDLATGTVTRGPVAELGFDYRDDSRLLIVNPPAAVAQHVADAGGCGAGALLSSTSTFYEWTGSRFNTLVAIDACQAP